MTRGVRWGSVRRREVPGNLGQELPPEDEHLVDKQVDGKGMYRSRRLNFVERSTASDESRMWWAAHMGLQLFSLVIVPHFHCVFYLIMNFDHGNES